MLPPLLNLGSRVMGNATHRQLAAPLYPVLRAIEG
jgi:hypothetical protein